MSRRIAVWAVAVVLLVGVIAFVVVRALSATPSAQSSGADLSTIMSQPHYVFADQSIANRDKIGIVPGSDPQAIRAFFPDQRCDRVSARSNLIVCLRPVASGQTSEGKVFEVKADGNLTPVRTFPLTGIPSRAAISPNLKNVASTVFETGPVKGGTEYEVAEGFTTRTAIHSVAQGGQDYLDIAKDFSIIKGGRPFKAKEMNVWGVTFSPTDPDRFFVTVESGGGHWLSEGSFKSRQIVTGHPNVECPSISPDGKRIGYKFPLGGGTWRLHVLNLETHEDRALDEARSIDDQIQWINDQTIMYQFRTVRPGADSKTDVWALDIQPGSQPRMLISDANSPSYVQGS